MSATQVVLVVLVLLAFVLGWVARGRREASDPASVRHATHAGEVDTALGAALTAFQAAQALWQVEGGAISPLGRRALVTFEERRAVVAGLSIDAVAPAEAQAALARAQTTLELLGSGIAAYAEGATLDADRSRALLRAERRFTAARSAFLLRVAGRARSSTS